MNIKYANCDVFHYSVRIALLPSNAQTVIWKSVVAGLQLIILLQVARNFVFE